MVTGASSGIGAASARALAAAGFRVLCAARRTDRIEALAEEIGGIAVACDVTSPDSVRGLADAAGDTLHVLVNNAGGAFGSDPVESADPDDWRRDVRGQRDRAAAGHPGAAAGAARQRRRR